MQLKYIVATIASLAVSSAIAGPVAEPAANDVASTHLVARAEAAADDIKGLHDKFGKRLLDAHVKNYVNNPNAVRPTLDDLKQLAAQKQKNQQQSLNKRWSFGYNYNYCRARRWRNGCQLYFPFSTHAHYFNWNLHDYYTCFDSYNDCSDWDNDGDCDCDYGYC